MAARKTARRPVAPSPAAFVFDPEQAEKDRRLKCALCYVPFMYINLLLPLYVIFTEKQDRELRFHALQALLLELALIVLVPFLLVFVIFLAILAIVALGVATAGLGLIAVPFLPFVLIPGILVFGLASLALWLYLAYKAYLGERVAIPYLAALAEKNA